LGAGVGRDVNLRTVCEGIVGPRVGRWTGAWSEATDVGHLPSPHFVGNATLVGVDPEVPVQAP